jgi:peptidoglycan/xylan/chitin deacetylase (PgdA/CDA1 family)
MKNQNAKRPFDSEWLPRDPSPRRYSVCLGYHKFFGIDPRSEKQPTQYDVDLGVAVAQIKRTIELGLPIVRFEQLADIHETNRGSDSVVSITIDDGHRSGLLFAEALSKMGVSATFFITPKFMMDMRGFFSKQDLRTLLELGMDIGAHGYTHAKLSNLSNNKLRFELKASKEWIEDVIQKEVATMVAPAGFLGSREIAAAHSLGYKLVGNSLEKTSLLPISNGVVDRICVRRHYDSRTFDKIICNDTFFYLAKRIRNRALYIPKKIASKIR